MVDVPVEVVQQVAVGEAQRVVIDELVRQSRTAPLWTLYRVFMRGRAATGLDAFPCRRCHREVAERRAHAFETATILQDAAANRAAADSQLAARAAAYL